MPCYEIIELQCIFRSNFRVFATVHVPSLIDQHTHLDTIPPLPLVLEPQSLI